MLIAAEESAWQGLASNLFLSDTITLLVTPSDIIAFDLPRGTEPGWMEKVYKFWIDLAFPENRRRVTVWTAVRLELEIGLFWYTANLKCIIVRLSKLQVSLDRWSHRPNLTPTRLPCNVTQAVTDSKSDKVRASNAIANSRQDPRPVNLSQAELSNAVCALRWEIGSLWTGFLLTGNPRDSSKPSKNGFCFATDALIAGKAVLSWRLNCKGSARRCTKMLYSLVISYNINASDASAFWRRSSSNLW